MHPFLAKLSADGGYQGVQFRKGLATILPDTPKVLWRLHVVGLSNALSPGSALSKAGQGLGKHQPQGAGFLAPRINSLHASKPL
jgi:hypothetical protein